MVSSGLLGPGRLRALWPAWPAWPVSPPAGQWGRTARRRRGAGSSQPCAEGVGRVQPSTSRAGFPPAAATLHGFGHMKGARFGVRRVGIARVASGRVPCAR